jgi:hypothetical protein
MCDLPAEVVMQFRATLQLNGKTATGIHVPDEVVNSLGAGKRPPVWVTIRDHTYRTSIGSMGGAFMLPVSAEQRTAAGIAAGDEVDVTVELDTEPRVVDMPADFAAALESDPEAGRGFAALPYSHQLRHVLAIQEAKAPETRQRRIEKALEMLRAGKR